MTDGFTAPREAAVIDVGSNSVRMVLYRLEGRAIWTVFNEKVLAGLGRDLPGTGRLSEAGVEMAMMTLRRFAAVLEGVRPAYTFVAATAAVREAEDGPDFCDRPWCKSEIHHLGHTGNQGGSRGRGSQVRRKNPLSLQLCL